MSRMSRIAEEAQLLAEEKWILDALTKIKHQRNCLQIERLHLESLRAQGIHKEETSNAEENQKQENTKGKCNQKQKNTKGKGNQKQEQAKGSQKQERPTVIRPNLNAPPQPTLDITSGLQLSASKRKLDDDIVDTKCNDEELDLTVSKSAFAQNLTKDNNLEESDEDEENSDNVVVDMDMFMHQTLGSSPPPS